MQQGEEVVTHKAYFLKKKWMFVVSKPKVYVKNKLYIMH